MTELISLQKLQEWEFEELRSFLIENPSNINLSIDEDGGTCLHYAAWGGYKELAELLLQELNDDVNKRSSDTNSTPLHFAAYGHDEIVELLLGSGADVNALDHDGNTPLHFAVFKNQKNIVEILLKHNARIDIVANDGMKPLDIAMEDGCDEEILRLLVGSKKTIRVDS